jgi:hypothetical protein
MERKFLKVAHRIINFHHIAYAERNKDASLVEVWFAGSNQGNGKLEFHNDEAREVWRELSAMADDLFPQATEQAGEI